MTPTKNPKEVILVNCHEIPETICVETRFITPAAVKQKKSDQIFYVTSKNGNFDLTRQEDLMTPTTNIRPISKPTTVSVSLQTLTAANQMPAVQQCQPPQQSVSTGPIMPLATTVTNRRSNSVNNSTAANGLTPLGAISLINTSHLQTLNLNTSVLPTISPGTLKSLNITKVKGTFSDQIQQTNVSFFNMKSSATQCDLDVELEDLDVEWPEIIEQHLEDAATEKETFLKFVKDNSAQHKYFKECLICGEIFKSSKYFYGHMEIHRGPKILCFKCGRNVDHKNLLRQHKCRKTQKLEKAFLQCPLHTCNVEAVSQLELYDHINEHTNNRMYECSACRKGFCTGQEYLRHLFIRAKCYTSARRKRFRAYGLESPNTRKCRVRVFTLHTFKKSTTLVKTLLTRRVRKRNVCMICLRSFPNKCSYNRHRDACVTKFRNRLIRKCI